MNIDLNFEDIYDLIPFSGELNVFSFLSPIIDGRHQLILVKIQNAANAFMPEFLNLAYGPPNQDGTIDDMAVVQHANYSKTFSTILFCALSYLKSNGSGNFIGIDGSDFRRAYLYFRTLQRNYEYLSKYFRLLGLKYYARVLRGKDKYDHMSVDLEELTHVGFSIKNKPLRNHKSLFNYFIFYLNS